MRNDGGGDKWASPAQWPCMAEDWSCLHWECSFFTESHKYCYVPSWPMIMWSPLTRTTHCVHPLPLPFPIHTCSVGYWLHHFLYNLWASGIDPAPPSFLIQADPHLTNRDKRCKLQSCWATVLQPFLGLPQHWLWSAGSCYFVVLCFIFYLLVTFQLLINNLPCPPHKKHSSKC